MKLGLRRWSTRPTRSAGGCAPRASRAHRGWSPSSAACASRVPRPPSTTTWTCSASRPDRSPTRWRPATSSTVIELDGRAHYAGTPADLPRVLPARSPRPGTPALKDGAGFGEMQAPSGTGTTAGSRRSGTRWSRSLGRADLLRLHRRLAAPSAAGFRHREAFGQVGFGTGGWDTDFPNSILEILRVVYTDADDEHRLIVGGGQQLPRRCGSTRRRAWPTGRAGRPWRPALRRPARRRGPASAATATATLRSPNAGATRTATRPW